MGAALAAVVALTGPIASRVGYAAAPEPAAPAVNPVPFVEPPVAAAETLPAAEPVPSEDRDGRWSTNTPDTNTPEHDPAPTIRAGTELLVEVRDDLRMWSRPGGGRIVGVLPDVSRFYHVPIVAWIQDVSADGRYGRLAIPYSASGRSGWIRVDDLRQAATNVLVRISLTSHRLTVERRGSTLFRAPTATGSASSPTPRGRYFVTDRVPFGQGSYLGRFAFGLSGIQPRLPAGWTGGDQLAIHGTSDPSSIGRSVSAGCLRVSDATLNRLIPLLRLGTPVIVER